MAATTARRPSILFLEVLLLVVGWSLHVAAANVIRETQQSSDTLPSIWPDGAGGAGLYRFLGEISLRNSDESYRFAEFASTAQSKFRFDLLETGSGRQSSYLADYTDGLILSFSPFTCALIDADQLGKQVSEKLGNLMPQVPVNASTSGAPIQELLLSAGIGSLWLYASRNEAKYRRPLQQTLNDTAGSDLWKGINVDSLQKVLVQPTAQYPRELSLFFKAGQRLEPNSLVLILVGDAGQADYLMRIRLLEGWSQLEGLGPLSGDTSRVFLPPVGYGCPEGPDSPVASKPQLPTSVLDGSMNWPHLLRFNVISVHPPADNIRAPMDKWRAHSSMIRLLAGRLSWGNQQQRLSSDYLALELQEFGPEQESEAIFGGSTRVSSVRRRRRVWDLGENGLARATTGNGTTEAIHLDIDERRAKCLGYGRGPSILSVNLNQDQREEEWRAQVGAPKLHELTLTNEFLQLLFGSSVAGFRLVQESVQNRLAELVFERREPNFELRAGDGSLVWGGPVSLIRRETWTIGAGPRVGSQWWATSRLRAEVASRLEWPPIKTGASVLFLAANLDGIISKLSLELIERRPISKSQLHRQLSAAALLCYTQLQAVPGRGGQSPMASNGWLSGAQAGRSGPTRRIRHNAAPLVALNYPFDIEPDGDGREEPSGAGSAQSGAAGQLGPEMEEKIYEQFLGLIGGISGGHFDSLRVAELGIRADSQSLSLRLEARLLEQPALLSFAGPSHIGYSGGRVSGKAGYSTELKESAASCADSCRHLACSAFVYCPASHECQLSYSNSAAQDSDSDNSTAPTEDCYLYQLTELATKRPEAMSSARLVRKLRELLESKPEELALNVQLGAGPARRLIPSSLESGPAVAGAGSGGSGDAGLSSSFEWPEYELVLRGRRFKSPRPGLRLAHHIAGHHDCELLCSQLDCSSFAHCPLEQVCYLDTDPHHDSTPALEQVTERATQETCHVFARNHLSKFERAGPPHSIGGAPFDDDQDHRTLTGGTARDCASSCIRQAGHSKCRSFYYCTGATDTATCLLSAKWHSAPSSTNVSLLAAADTNSDNPANELSISDSGTCQLYKRSYLVEFDKFPGRALAGELLTLDSESADGSRAQVGADACALECVMRLELDKPCRAFQICRGPTAQGAPVEPQCSFRFGWLSRAPEPGQGEAGMVDSDLCSVFIPAADSQLFAGLAAGPQPNKHQPWPQKTSAGSLLELLWELPILLSLGLAIGLTLAASLRGFRMR